MATTNTQKNADSKKRVLSGIVMSDKMKDTIVVKVQRFVKHPKYGKFLKHAKRYKAHDPSNKHKIGETVEIEECRPISKDKHFRVVEK